MYVCVIRMFLVAWMFWCMTAYYHTLNNVVNSFDVVKAGLISRMSSLRDIELGDTNAHPPSLSSSSFASRKDHKKSTVTATTATAHVTGGNNNDDINVDHSEEFSNDKSNT